MRSPGLALYLAMGRRFGSAEAVDADTPARPEGPLVWFHAATTARVAALHQLLERLMETDPDISVLLTATRTDTCPDAQPSGVLHAETPTDHPKGVDAFLTHWRPDVAVFVGNELWPAMIVGCSDRSIPLLMVDAHFPGGRVGGWRWARWASAALLGRFDHILTGSVSDAEMLRALGARPGTIEVPGFLEEWTPAPAHNEAERTDLAELIAGRPVWLAAYASQDELSAIEAAHRRASRASHRLLLIYAPKDTWRGPAAQKRLERHGWRVARRSEGEEPDEEVQVYIADTDGEMGLWFRLAPITFIGESLASPGGGHDPFEPAGLGSAIVHGPRMARYELVLGRLDAAGAARRVANGAELGETVAELLAPDVAAEMASRAWRVSTEGAEVTDRVIELIAEAVDRVDA